MRYFCPSAMMSQEQVHAINPRRYSLTVDSFLNSFLRYSCYSYSFEKAKTGAFRPHESFFDEGQTKENEDEDNFF